MPTLDKCITPRVLEDELKQVAELITTKLSEEQHYPTAVKKAMRILGIPAKDCGLFLNQVTSLIPNSQKTSAA